MSGINNFKYVFTKPKTCIFLTGAPLSGKSILSQIILSYIQDCGIQSMDIIRLLNIKFEELKITKKRNIFYKYGSCDSYVSVGSGVYSDESLIKGFQENSKSICSVLEYIMPNLEKQGVMNVIFEGVQLNPKIIKKYLLNNNKLIIISTNKRQFQKNGQKLYGQEFDLRKRYDPRRLILIQKNIIEQSKDLEKDKVIYINNTRSCTNVAIQILEELEKLEVIKKITTK